MEKSRNCFLKLRNVYRMNLRYFLLLSIIKTQNYVERTQHLDVNCREKFKNITSTRELLSFMQTYSFVRHEKNSIIYLLISLK